MFDEVAKRVSDFREKPILDIGIGDRETISRFVEAGCINLTGVDLNSTMLAQAKNRFRDKVRLVQGDVRSLDMFQEEDFKIVISGATIHNIPKAERVKIWQELLRLNPDLIVMFDKIADDDPEKHKDKYESEVRAIDMVYRVRHGLKEEAKEWKEHYEQDEREIRDAGNY